jgi:hypothetical protein
MRRYNHLIKNTFQKYGFEPVYDREGVDEVLEKEIEDNILPP